MKKVISILLVSAAFGVVVAAFLPIKQLVYHSPDDAFFYLKTAWNYAAGYGSTFDGISPTNGYHPLWFLALTCMYWTGEIVGVTSPDTFFRLSFVLGWFLLIATVWFAFASLERETRAGNPPDKRSRYDASHGMLLLLLVYFLVFIRVVGSEAIISTAVLAAYLWIKAFDIEERTSRHWLKGALLALLFLARIDYISNIVPALVAGDAMTTGKPLRLKTLAVSVVMIGAVASAYFTVNFLAFGHFLTVSASLKSVFPDVVLFSNIPYYLTANPVQFARAIASIAVCVVFAVNTWRNRKSSTPYGIALAWLAAGCAAFLIQTMSFNAHKIREWYTSVPVFVSILIFIRYSLRWRAISKYVLLPGALAAAVFLAGAGFAVRHWDANYDFAYTLKRNIPPNSPVLIVDCAGIVGYFSQRKVLCGDGLVNSFEYLDSVKAGRLRGFLSKYRIPYYATYSAVQPDSLNGAYIDAPVTGLGGMPFIFDSSHVVLTAPFAISNIRFQSRGKWIVFKLRN